MIEFNSEWVRTEFHSLPADIQREYHDMAINFASRGFFITVVGIDRWGTEPRQYEVAIRIDQKFTSAGSVEF